MTDPQPIPRRGPLNSLSTKVISFVFLSTFLTAMVVSWISIQSTYATVRRQLDRDLPALLQQSDPMAQRWLEDARTALAEARVQGAATRALVQFRRDEGVGRAAARGALADFVEQSEHFSGAALVAASGELVAAADLEIDLVQALGDAAPTPAPAEWRIAETDQGIWRVAALSAAGNAGARLIATLDTGRLAEALGAPLPDVSTQLFLLGPTGQMLAATNARSQPALRAPTLSLLAQPSDSVREYMSGSDRHVLGSARPLGETGFHLAAEVPFEDAFAPVLTLFTRIFVSDMVIILLASFLAYRITSAILKPVQALSEGARSLSRGDFDHEIPDQGSRDEIGLLTRTFNDMTKKLRRNRAEIEQQNRRLTEQYEELLSANEVLAQLSITDGLTKLHNHRYFQDHLTREIKRVSRSQEPLTMLLIDLDDFKQLNDRQGHAAGDELLVRVAQIMNASVRESDLLARYGGEEFVVLASNTDLEGGLALAEKIRTSVAEAKHILDDSMRPTQVTISVGAAAYEGNRRRFFQSADRALYEAKARGKNCVVAARGDELIG